MEKTVLRVEGMSCSHCVNVITKSAEALEGVNKVQVDLEGKTVALEYDAAKVSLDRIKSEIEDQGYEVV